MKEIIYNTLMCHFREVCELCAQTIESGNEIENATCLGMYHMIKTICIEFGVETEEELTKITNEIITKSN